MVLVISQESFNDAVRENIEDLGLSPEEAVKEAVVQFESQGVDLSAIIKELMITSTTTENISEEVRKLVGLNKANAPSKRIIEQLEVIRTECDKSLQHRVSAAKSGAYDAILDAITKTKNDAEVEKSGVKALISLMDKHPDLLDDRGVALIISNLKKETAFELKKLTLKWTKECCIMHEMNRQKIFDAHILASLKELLNEGTSDMLREVLAVCRSLVLDDDVRVEFGRAHEHARIIASETLCSLTGMLTRFRLDEPLINDLMLTLTALLVRTEFCQKVEGAGGLELVKDVMTMFSSSDKINRHCFKLIKALAGNDECKAHMIQKGFAPAITEALGANKQTLGTAIAGLGCVSALTLRSPENSKQFYEAGIPAVIVDIMKLYPDEKQVQKTASWAIRNMVSRSRYQCDAFLRLGIEEILHSNLKKFKDIEYDTKAALRDLDCKVNLKEEWTGKGGALTTSRWKHDE